VNPDPTLTAEADAFVDHEQAHDDSSAPTESHERSGDADADNGSVLLLVGFGAALVALGAFYNWWIPGLVVGLLFMLFMHELGHFVTARASGMKVSEFFLGFGPKIWSFNRGETEYGVKAIPAGAYVRILGMTNLDDVEPHEEDRAYRSQPYWQRMMTILAGSFMHFVMAIIALVVLFAAYNYSGFEGPGWNVARVVEDSSAQRIGLVVGDEIQTFNGDQFDNWEDFGALVTAAGVGPVEVEVLRDGQVVRLSGVLDARSGDVVGLGFGVRMNEDRLSQGWEIEALLDGGPAEEFGLAAGDVFLRVGDSPRPSQLDVAAELVAAEGAPLDITVLRGETEVALTDTVVLDRSTPYRGFLGVGPGSLPVPDHSLGESVGLAFSDFVTVSRTNLSGLASMVNPMRWIGDDTASEPSGAAFSSPTHGTSDGQPAADEGSGRPVSIVGIGRLFAQSESVDQVLYLFMVVNIFIGIFNLVPLLPLDGGHAALATYERGRQLVSRDRSYRFDAIKLVPLTWFVVLLLVVVGVWTFFLDIFSWPV